jgi:hypothetical protein
MNLFKTLGEILKPTYIIQSRESGDVIELFDSYDKAEKRLSEFEKSDKDENIFVENFYEIKILNQ